MVYGGTARRRSTTWPADWTRLARHTGQSGGTRQTFFWQADARRRCIPSCYKCWLSATMPLLAMIRTPIARLIGGLPDCSWQRERGYASWRSTSTRDGGVLASTARLLATGRQVLRMGWSIRPPMARTMPAPYSLRCTRGTFARRTLHTLAWTDEPFPLPIR